MTGVAKGQRQSTDSRRMVLFRYSLTEVFRLFVVEYLSRNGSKTKDDCNPTGEFLVFG